MASGEVAKKNVDETSRKTGNSPINTDFGRWKKTRRHNLGRS
jgi:hypothetical protein